MADERRKEREDRREGREQRKEADRGVGERKGRKKLEMIVGPE